MTGHSHLIVNTTVMVAYHKFINHFKYNYFGWFSDEIVRLENIIHTKFFSFTDFKTLSDYVDFVWFFVFYIIGSLLPDIDSENSMLGKYFYIGLEHRTYTHSILFIPFGLGILSFFNDTFFYILLGYLMHLFFDSFSVMGVCLFYPFSKYRVYGKAKIKKGHIFKIYKTSSKSEYFFVSFVAFLCLFIFVKYDTVLSKILKAL